MITFDLSCQKGHKFEGWFRNREDFEDQMDRRIIACPLCGATTITKRLSAVAVHLGRRAEKTMQNNYGSDKNPTEVSQGGSPKGDVAVSAPNPREKDKGFKAEPFFRALDKFVQENFEDVGASFADEARKIENGDVNPRNIRGTTTPTEEKNLEEEGIKFMKIPMVKYDA